MKRQHVQASNQVFPSALSLRRVIVVLQALLWLCCTPVPWPRRLNVLLQMIVFSAV